MRHLAHFYSSTSLPTIFRCPMRRMRNISVCVFAACCFRCRRQPRNDHRRISSSLSLRISSSSPSSYSQLNVHFSVKQAVKWHFRCRCRCRCRSSRCFVWFGLVRLVRLVRLVVWLLRAVQPFCMQHKIKLFVA